MDYTKDTTTKTVKAFLVVTLKELAYITISWTILTTILWLCITYVFNMPDRLAALQPSFVDVWWFVALVNIANAPPSNNFT